MLTKFELVHTYLIGTLPVEKVLSSLYIWCETTVSSVVEIGIDY